MKQRFWLLRRGGVYYLQDSFSGKRESLQIKDPQTAAKIRDARIEVNQRPELSLALGRAYLKVHDPDMAKRTWADVMEEQAKRGAETTQERCCREIKTKPFDLIRNKPLVETTAGDLLGVIRLGNNSTNGFLRIFHHLAFGLGWIYRAILPSKLWPRIKKKKRRAITLEEHQRIMATECNAERRLYYALLWETGASQTDGAKLCAENINWSTRTLCYQRQKLGPESKPAVMAIGKKLEALLKQLPSQGPLFPHQSTLKTSIGRPSFTGAARCSRLSESVFTRIVTHGLSAPNRPATHNDGRKKPWDTIPRRFTKYAKGATVICPPLEDFEERSAQSR
jgi:hypothetical protein